MTKKCKGCKTVYSNGVWLSDEGLCSICYSVKRFNKEAAQTAQDTNEKKSGGSLNKWLGNTR